MITAVHVIIPCLENVCVCVLTTTLTFLYVIQKIARLVVVQSFPLVQNFVMHRRDLQDYN